MNKKTITAVLKKKFNDFTSSIKDEEVKALVEKNSIITGGSIASMLLGEDVNDFDIYFTNKKTTLAVAQYYVKEFLKNSKDWFAKEFYVEDESPESEEEGRVKIFIKSAGVATAEDETGVDDETEDAFSDLDLLDTNKDFQDKPKEKYRPIWLSSNAITLSDKIQLVLRFYGDAENIHSNYDFAHCTNYWESKSNKLTLKQEALEALLSKELKYIGSKYPICSLIRTRKFITRGWHINAGQYMKIVLQIHELDLQDVEVLKEQLIGLDSAYFDKIIEQIKERKVSNPDFNFDSNYLAKIIDMIF